MIPSPPGPAPRLGFADRLRIPVIAAPMLRISGPELVSAACAAGVAGAFPTANARSIDELDTWLGQITSGHRPHHAPWCANLIIRQPRLEADLACLIRHRPEVVITSVGSPRDVIAPLHEVGTTVLADVATVRHAERAAADGADGLVLLSAGAGGQTGWLNPFAFVREVRRFFDGVIVLAGGISDGVALRAAITLGCDLAYVGTRFIATHESRAEAAYRSMLVSSSMDDVLLTSAFTGLRANMLRPSIVAAGLDPEALDEDVTAETAAETYGAGSSGPRRWADVWSAGHTVSGVDALTDVATLVDALHRDFVSTDQEQP